MPTGLRPVPRDRLERELTTRYSDGQPLVLLVPPRLLAAAEERMLSLFSLRLVAVEELLLRHLHAVAEANEVDWAVLVEADSQGPSGPFWGNLQGLVDEALANLEVELLPAGEPVLLKRFGLLARFGRLNLLEK